MNSRKLNITTSGATAVCAIIHSEFVEDNDINANENSRNNRKLQSKNLYVANVGDSRAVLVHPFTVFTR